MLKSFELSLVADQDLQDIFDYTFEEFGIDQAVDYVSSFDQAFENIIQNPEIGRKRDEIKEGLRSVLKEQHTVFYRLLDNRIRIVRILHASRDVPRLFED